MTFPDNWPTTCPPKDAVDADGEVYRIVNAEALATSDFLSNFETEDFPDRPACLRCGLSVFRLITDAIHTRLKYPRLGSRIAKGSLTSLHGKLKATGRPSHHTWWVCENVDRASLFALVAEEG